MSLLHDSHVHRPNQSKRVDSSRFIIQVIEENHQWQHLRQELAAIAQASVRQILKSGMGRNSVATITARAMADAMFSRADHESYAGGIDIADAIRDVIDRWSRPVDQAQVLNLWVDLVGSATHRYDVIGGTR